MKNTDEKMGREKDRLSPSIRKRVCIDDGCSTRYVPRDDIRGNGVTNDLYVPVIRTEI